MTEQLEALRSSVVAAVQEELTRFSAQVSTEMQRLRDELAIERAARAKTEAQLQALAPAMESRLSDIAGTSKRRFEEMDVRIGRVTDEANIGIAAAVEAAARPVLQKVVDRQDEVDRNVATLDRTVHKFDEQAGKIVQHLNAVSEATDARFDEVTAEVAADADARIVAVSTRIDEVSAQAARHQAEVSNIVGNRVDQAEERLNERILATEGRLSEDLGQRVADIDAYVGRVSAGLDDSVTMLSDRITASDARFEDVNAAFDVIAKKIDDVDIDAIDEMKDRVGGLAGEVELIRIESERFQKTIDATIDTTNDRLVEVETQLQEQHMDVETAVQLERLEEVERAIIALDPSQFVRRDEAPSLTMSSASSPFSAPQAFSPSVNAEI